MRLKFVLQHFVPRGTTLAQKFLTTASVRATWESDRYERREEESSVDDTDSPLAPVRHKALLVIAQAVMIVTSIVGMRAAEGRRYWPVMLASFLVLPVRGTLAYFLTGWWGVLPVQVLDGIGTGLQSVAVPGMVARSLNGTGWINLGQGAVITVQGIGASLSPGLGGWVAQWIGCQPAFCCSVRSG